MKLNKQKKEILFFGIFLLLGIFFRFVNNDLIEYKYDQIYFYEKAKAVPAVEPWPSIGMKSGASLINPPMGSWAFILLGKVFGTESPVSLNNGVIFLNCLALILFAIIAYRQRDKKEKLIWTLAFAIAVVNPIQIRYDRVIWPQSLLPFFSLLTLWFWMNRKKVSSMFFWGLLGSLIGQVHMSGFFFAFALFLWTAFLKKRALPLKHWGFWVLGSVIGTAFMVGWVYYLMQNPSQGTSYHSFNVRFWSSWLSSPLGIHVGEVVGAGNGMLAKNLEYFKYPILFGVKTGLNGLIHWITFFGGIALLLRGVVYLIRFKRERLRVILGQSSDRALAISSVMIGMGILFSIAGVFSYRHYLIVVYPLGYLFLAGLLFLTLSQKNAIRVGAVLVIFQAIMSLTFHQYISMHCGSPIGEFQTAYRCQVKNK